MTQFAKIFNVGPDSADQVVFVLVEENDYPVIKVATMINWIYVTANINFQNYEIDTAWQMAGAVLDTGVDQTRAVAYYDDVLKQLESQTDQQLAAAT